MIQITLKIHPEDTSRYKMLLSLESVCLYTMQNLSLSCFTFYSVLYRLLVLQSMYQVKTAAFFQVQSKRFFIPCRIIYFYFKFSIKLHSSLESTFMTKVAL